MMKTVSKKHYRAILSVMMAGSFLMPSFSVLAATEGELRTKNLFCNNIDIIKNRFDQSAENVYKNLKERRDKRIENLRGYQAKRDTEITTDRNRHNQERERGYQKLEGLADTDEERAAVATFEKTLDAAVTTNRTAIDTAIKTSRDGLDQAIANHTNGAEKAAQDFRSKTDAAFKQAASDCTKNVSLDTIRQHLKSVLTEARKTFVATIEDIAAFRSIQEDLRNTRNASLKSAEETFEKTADQARADLKKAFGED
jgi:hypothetical protein